MIQVSDRDIVTMNGPTELSEMCVVLLMYYVDPNESDVPEDSWPKMCNTGWREMGAFNTVEAS